MYYPKLEHVSLGQPWCLKSLREYTSHSETQEAGLLAASDDESPLPTQPLISVFCTLKNPGKGIQHPPEPNEEEIVLVQTLVLIVALIISTGHGIIVLTVFGVCYYTFFIDKISTNITPTLISGTSHIT